MNSESRGTAGFRNKKVPHTLLSLYVLVNYSDSSRYLATSMCTLRCLGSLEINFSKKINIVIVRYKLNIFLMLKLYLKF